MSWKDRAEPVAKASGWRSRAEALKVATGKPPEWDEEGVESDGDDPNDVGAVMSGVVGGATGITGGYADELGGLVDAIVPQRGVARGLAELAVPLSRHFTADTRMALDSEPAKPLTITKRKADASGRLREIDRKTTQNPNVGPDVPSERSFGEKYRSGRDSMRDLQHRALEQHPETYIPAEIGGDVLAQAGVAAITGGANLTPGGQSLMGGLSALGSSEDDLTTGDLENYGSAALKTGGGAAVGYAIPKGMNWAGKKLANSRLSRYFATNIGAAVQDAEDIATKKTEKTIASKLGEYRSSVQSASRDLEVLEREAASGTGEVADQARAFLKTREAQKLREMVLENKLKTAPQRLGESAALESEHATMAAGKGAAIAERQASELANPVKKQVLPRLKTYATRAIPIAVSTGVGSAIGGLPGAAVGFIGGGVTAAAMGAPGTALSNMVKHPGFRKMAWESLQKTMSTVPEKLGRFGPVIAREAERHGWDAAKALDLALMERNPEYAQAREKALQEEEEGQLP